MARMDKKFEEGHKQGLVEGEKKGHKKGLAEGEKKGHEKGLVEGEEKGKLKVARAMRAEGLDEKTIAKITGLTLQQVQALD